MSKICTSLWVASGTLTINTLVWQDMYGNCLLSDEHSNEIDLENNKLLFTRLIVDCHPIISNMHVLLLYAVYTILIMKYLLMSAN